MANTPYNVRIAPAALRHIRALPNKSCKGLLKLIEALAINPRPPGVQKIEGMTGLYSQQIDNCHLIFKVEEQEVLLLLIKQT